MATGRIGTNTVLTTRWSKAPAGGTTSLSGLDDNSVSLVYSVGYEQVYRNGVLLSRGNDYTATNGTTITLIDATITGDIIEVFANATIPLTDTYSQTVANGKFINNTLTTTTGDIIYASAANTPARLGIGSTGNVLTVSGGVPAWSAPAAGGGMTVIASGTLSGASVTISSISGAYKDLRLVIKNWKPATDNETLKAQLNGNTGSSYYASVAMSTNPNNVTFNDTFIYICSFQDNGTAEGFSQTTFYEYANTTTWKAYEGITVNNNATTVTNFNALYQNGFFNSTAAITEIKLFPNAGNHTSGNYILYGIN